MKKVCFKKLVTTLLIIILVVMQPRPIFAKESTSDDFTSEIEFSQEKESSDDIKIFATSDETPTIKTDV